MIKKAGSVIGLTPLSLEVPLEKRSLRQSCTLKAMTYTVFLTDSFSDRLVMPQCFYWTTKKVFYSSSSQIF